MENVSQDSVTFDEVYPVEVPEDPALEAQRQLLALSANPPDASVAPVTGAVGIDISRNAAEDLAAHLGDAGALDKFISVLEKVEVPTFDRLPEPVRLAVEQQLNVFKSGTPEQLVSVVALVNVCVAHFARAGYPADIASRVAAAPVKVTVGTEAPLTQLRGTTAYLVSLLEGNNDLLAGFRKLVEINLQARVSELG